MKKNYTIITLSVFTVFSLAKGAWAANCNDLSSCTKVMHELKGDQYIWDTTSDRKKITSLELELNKENAELVFTAMLEQADLARIPVGDGKTYRIVSTYTRRDQDMPMLEGSAESEPKFPETWDWVELRYKTKTRKLAKDIENMYRLYVSREARLNADTNAGFIIVDAPAPVARRMYQVFKKADIPETLPIKEAL